MISVWHGVLLEVMVYDNWSMDVCDDSKAGFECSLFWLLGWWWWQMHWMPEGVLCADVLVLCRIQQSHVIQSYLFIHLFFGCTNRFISCSIEKWRNVKKKSRAISNIVLICCILNFWGEKMEKTFFLNYLVSLENICASSAHWVTFCSSWTASTLW